MGFDYLWDTVYRYNKVVCIANNKNIKPQYMNYLSDEYRGIKYVWKLTKYYNTIEIENVIPVCDCDGFLTTKYSYKNRHYGSPKLYCVNCDKIIKNDFNEEVLEDAKLYFCNKLNDLIKEENNKLN